MWAGAGRRERGGLLRAVLMVPAPGSFRLVPFLVELRAVMDWVWTDTTLSLSSWMCVEDIYANIFIIKCSRETEKVPGPKAGSEGTGHSPLGQMGHTTTRWCWWSPPPLTWGLPTHDHMRPEGASYRER